MRSRAERREVLEAVLRVASIALLAWMLWLSLRSGRAYQVVSTRSADLPRALREWSTSGVAPDVIHVQLDSSPVALERDWLAALAGAGSKVSWGGSLPPIGVDVQPFAAPRGGLTILAAAPNGTRIVLSDDVGALDTVDARGGGARFLIPAAMGTIDVHADGSHARASVPDPVQLRRVLVLGDAGWEAKFVVAALEEDGWKVDAQMRVAPDASVTQGSIVPIDTSRFSAVIALDATAAPRAAELARYVASGGGLILAGSAASNDAFASLRAGGTGRADAAPTAAIDRATTTLRSLSMLPVTGLKSDAVILERRGGAVAIAARRHGAGRVLQTGYLDSWRWRMSGGETSVADHRTWWTRAVASVAHTTRASTSAARFPAGDSIWDNAPLAKLVEALGTRAVALTVRGGPVSESLSPTWLFALLALCLLAEWASRRLRGAR